MYNILYIYIICKYTNLATSRIGRLITRSVVGLQCSSMFKHSQKLAVDHCCGPPLTTNVKKNFHQPGPFFFT